MDIISFYFDLTSNYLSIYLLLPLITIFLVVVIARPQVMVFIVAFILPFNTSGGQFGQDSILIQGAKILLHVAVYSLILLSLDVIFSKKYFKDAIFLRKPLQLWILSLIFSVLLGFYFSNNPSYIFRESNWLLYYLFLLPVIKFVKTKRQIILLLVFMTIGLIIVQIMSFNYLVSGQRFGRSDWGGGLSFIRLLFSESARFVLLTALAFLVIDITSNWLSFMSRSFILTLVIFLFAGLIGSFGRFLWFSFGMGVIFMIYRSGFSIKILRYSIVFCIIALSAFAVVSYLDNQSIESSGDLFGSINYFLNNVDDASSIGRIWEFKTAIAAWMYSPLFGVGFGHDFGYNPLYDEFSGDLDRFFIHNSYASILAKQGLFGFLVFVVLVIRSFQLMNVLWLNNYLSNFEKSIILGCMASLFSILIHSVSGPSISTGDSIIQATINLGLPISINRLVLFRCHNLFIK